jgi:ribosomal protein S18 acetylase RimI-like enzyme
MSGFTTEQRLEMIEIFKALFGAPVPADSEVEVAIADMDWFTVLDEDIDWIAAVKAAGEDFREASVRDWAGFLGSWSTFFYCAATDCDRSESLHDLFIALGDEASTMSENLYQFSPDEGMLTRFWSFMLNYLREEYREPGSYAGVTFAEFMEALGMSLQQNLYRSGLGAVESPYTTGIKKVRASDPVWFLSLLCLFVPRWFNEGMAKGEQNPVEYGEVPDSDDKPWSQP